MKKMDLHIHTLPAFYEDDFEFNIENLENYVSESSIDCIAITNHNFFDSENYQQVKENIDAVVLPGIEIDVMNGHLLLIAEDTQDSVRELLRISHSLGELIVDENSSISVNEFKEIVRNESNYLIIPHYRKDKSLDLDIIRQISSTISVGEVSSPRKFQRVYDENELVPVLFSDSRANDETIFCTRQTFINIELLNMNTIKLALSDRSNVSLNQQNKVGHFDVNGENILASTRLNVIYGKRCSGKTYLLDNIYDLHKDNTKYIEQFELTEKSKVKKFEEKIQKENIFRTNEYLNPLRTKVNQLLNINLSDFKTEVKDYTDKLVTMANNTYELDEYSKATLYNQGIFKHFETQEVINVISSIDNLLGSEYYQNELKDIIEPEKLKLALKKSVSNYEVLQRKNFIIKKSNESIELIREKLEKESIIPQVPLIDVKNVFSTYVDAVYFNETIKIIREDGEVLRRPLGKFQIVTYKKKFTNVTEAKNFANVTSGCSDEFNEYYDKQPYVYLAKLRDLEISSDLIYKMFFKTDHVVINENGIKLSGGQRSEYNLLQKLKDANNYDYVLIDEPEGSFDNLFLRDEIITKINEIAESSTVFIATHNNTVGVSLNPNNVLYTKVEHNDGNNEFSVFYGSFSEGTLRDSEGNEIESYTTIIESMEAGETSYNERNDKYVSLKNIR